MALVAAIVSLRATGASGTGSVPLSNSTPVVQDFTSLANSGTSTALPPGWSVPGPIDRRMDMNQDGETTRVDLAIWLSQFIDWQRGRK
jgi:hypothetical protein